MYCGCIFQILSLLLLHFMGANGKYYSKKNVFLMYLYKKRNVFFFCFALRTAKLQRFFCSENTVWSFFYSSFDLFIDLFILFYFFSYTFHSMLCSTLLSICHIVPYLVGQSKNVPIQSRLTLHRACNKWNDNFFCDNDFHVINFSTMSARNFCISRRKTAKWTCV